jgi:Co/Zn/Cd efflux system component
MQCVAQVHSLHLWALTTTVPVCSAHLTTGPGEEPARVRLQATGLLRARHGIYRCTLQVTRPEPAVRYNAVAGGGAPEPSDGRV